MQSPRSFTTLAKPWYRPTCSLCNNEQFAIYKICP